MMKKGWLVAALFAASVTAKLPNIVVFISDDLGRLETSVYGSTEVMTPTMDRLAASGMTFDNAYVASPSCCPNRFSLLTGLMPSRHGAHANHSSVKPGTHFLMPEIQRLGYHVASFGKVAHGKAGYDGLDKYSGNSRDMHKAVFKHFGASENTKPVCLWVGDRRPHVSWVKKSAYDPEEVTLPGHFIDTPETRAHWARYLTDITGMDKEMGRIYDFALETWGEDTLFVFTSDHGGQWPLGKWNLYDSGTRIPLIVSWPGKIAAGVRSDAMVSWVDLLPTLMDAAGGEAPAKIDGRSFLPVLLGKTRVHRDKIFTTHTGDGEMNIFPMRSVRVGKYKFIHNLCPDAYHTNHSDRHRKDGAGAYWDSWDAAAKSDPRAAAFIQQYYTRPEFEFFDLEKDPLELNNLALNPEVKSKMAGLQEALATWTTSQEDELEPHRPPYLRSSPIPLFKAPIRRRK